MALSKIGTNSISDSAVATAKIADDAVASAKIADSAIATAKIADSAVATAKIADNAIVTGKITDGTIATADIADSAVTAAKASGLGISEMDSWRITSDFTGNQTPISSNWERVDSYNWSKLGTGLSQSSGVFSMPSTGFWLIIARHQVINTGGNAQAGLALQVTNDNSSYSTVIDAPSNTSTANVVQSHTLAYVMDVDNTSNDKFRLSFGASESSFVVQGDSNKTMTGFTIIKIAET